MTKNDFRGFSWVITKFLGHYCSIRSHINQMLFAIFVIYDISLFVLLAGSRSRELWIILIEITFLGSVNIKSHSLSFLDSHLFWPSCRISTLYLFLYVEIYSNIYLLIHLCFVLEDASAAVFLVNVLCYTHSFPNYIDVKCDRKKLHV